MTACRSAPCAAARPALASGESVCILTGADVPPNADAVVMVEDSEAMADGKVRILSPVSRGRNKNAGISPKAKKLGNCAYGALCV